VDGNIIIQASPNTFTSYDINTLVFIVMEKKKKFMEDHSMELFTKEEIEKYGFIYEPDETKCKTAKTGPHYKCNYYKDGVFTDTAGPVLTDEWKELVVEHIKSRIPQWTYFHSIFVPDVSPMSGEGVRCQFVMVRGHGNELVDKWFKTGFLDDIALDQYPEAALFFHHVAKEIIRSNPTKGTPEWDRFDKLAGLVLPVAHDLFKKCYPHTPDPKWIMEQCEKFFDEHQSLYEDLKQGIAQDHEREFGELCLMELERSLSYEMFRRTK